MSDIEPHENADRLLVALTLMKFGVCPKCLHNAVRPDEFVLAGGLCCSRCQFEISNSKQEHILRMNEDALNGIAWEVDQM
jgi:hypothetical protein